MRCALLQASDEEDELQRKEEVRGGGETKGREGL